MFTIDYDYYSRRPSNEEEEEEKVASIIRGDPRSYFN